MGTSDADKKIVLGDEYDSDLRAALLQALHDLGAHNRDQWQGVGGSQEIESLTVTIGGQAIQVEAETYVGLSLSGEAMTVDKIAILVREILDSRDT